MDLTFGTPEGVFNFRVCAIILHEGHLLAMHSENSPYYYLPGGRVQLHETMEHALSRELAEELGIRATIVRPLWLNQSFFNEDVTKEQFHELCMYFLVDVTDSDLLTRGSTFRTQERHRAHDFTWLPIERLGEEYLYPLFLKDAVFHIPDHLTLIEEYD